jgi:hypothetical protein
MIEAWFSFQLAAEEVERRLGVNWGAAQKALIEAIENGDVKSQRDPDADFPDLWGPDLESWLEAKGKSSKARSSPQQELAKEAIAALWPEGNIPAKTKEMEKPICDWVAKHRKGRHPPSRDSIGRAATQIRNARDASPLVPDL